MAFDLPLPSFSSLDKAQMRSAGRELLSLALMDARNHTLYLLAQFEQSMGAQGMAALPLRPELDPPLWLLGHIGWFQERWLGRNLQRHQGSRCDPHASPLASIETHADRWWDDSRVPHDSRWALDLPSLEDTRAYLLATLESTLDLLEKTPDEDDALYFYRLALFHEDQLGETLITMAQTLGVRVRLELPTPGVARPPLWLPATRWRLGLDLGHGFSFDVERPAHEVAVPEFEIDAQPVSWEQYVEFVADGGYDRPEFWQGAGWTWLQDQMHREGRRAPRHVEQIAVARGGAQGAVLQRCFGQPVRMAGTQPVMHVSWWEADAWCRWAGRRLPSEVEWELAAHRAAPLGLRWGEVWEWTGTTFYGYPGYRADPWRDPDGVGFGTHKVLRGASFATRARLKSAKLRSAYLPGRDDIFCGFRSCAL